MFNIYEAFTFPNCLNKRIDEGSGASRLYLKQTFEILIIFPNNIFGKKTFKIAIMWNN